MHTWNAADYYGVEKNGHDKMLQIDVCPFCGSEDIEEFDDSELEESPEFDDEEWTQIVEDAWQVTQAINKTMEYADAIGDKILMKQVSILSKRFTNMKGDMQL
jgi:hypothetical protein